MEKIADIRRWEDLLCSWTDTLYTAQINPQDSNAISIRIPIRFFTELKTKIIKPIWKNKRIQTAKGF